MSKDERLLKVKQLRPDATENKNFRQWKSGKNWLYASTLFLATVAGGVAVGGAQAKADGQLLTTGTLTGTNNTATGSLGSNASAGADNASAANANNAQLSGVLASANPSNYTDASGLPTGSLAQDGTNGKPNGVAETKNSEDTNGSAGVNSTVKNTSDAPLFNASNSSYNAALGSTATNNLIRTARFKLDRVQNHLSILTSSKRKILQAAA